MTPLLWALFGLLAAAAVAGGWYASFMVTAMTPMANEIAPDILGLPFEDVSFKASDGLRLAGWFVPSEKGSDATVVVCHGWGANRADVLPLTAFLHRQGGYNLFYFDFRAHGDSEGRFSTLGPYESRDLEAALDWLKENKPAATRRLGVFGLSMGGAVSLTVTARRPEISAVAAESSFASYKNVVARFAWLFHRIPRFPLVPLSLFFVRHRLGLDPETHAPVHHIGKIAPRPIFLIQGDRDVRMPASEGEQLFAAAKEPKTLWTIPGADHGEPAGVAGKEYEDRLLAFFDTGLKAK